MNMVKQYYDDYNKYAKERENINRSRQESEKFVREEKQFHLGFLPTEQSHPYTIGFSENIQRNTKSGLKQLLRVDYDLPPVARRIVLSPEFDELVTSIFNIIESKNRICFSGCGSTGRLSILMESLWREFWLNEDEPEMANLGSSIMTGGDRALIRSVESFEDYEVFGRRQVRDLSLSENDLLIAVSEGGETSSVIGTAKEGVDRSCKVFFLYNNPSTILSSNISRSREILNNDQITCIDLFTGSMALTGSTRMQATTLELFILGAALDEAFSLYKNIKFSNSCETRISRVNCFARLINLLDNDENMDSMKRFAEIEADTYKQNGLITYYANRYLLDIFSDTTERSPTFMLPPYARYNEEAISSWAFAKDPDRSTVKAWDYILGRKPRGIDWKEKDYSLLSPGSQYEITAPQLGYEEIIRYAIGNEKDASRFPEGHNHVFLISGNDNFSPVSIPEDTGITKVIIQKEEAVFQSTLEDRSIMKFTYPSDSSLINLYGHLAVKLIFNTVSTSVMGLLGRIESNWMIQVDPTNKKLIDRGSRIIAELSELTYKDACYELYLSIFARKTAESHGEDTTLSPVVAALNRIKNGGL